MELELVRMFVEVAERRSFTAAARALGLPRSSVSRRVAKLEADLGVQLLHRTTRRIGLTGAGEALYARVADPLAAIARAIEDLPDEAVEAAGELRVTAPHDLAVEVCGPAFAEFSRRYPRVLLDVRATSERLDLVADGIDVAIRPGPRELPDSSLRARRLGETTASLYASPAYLQRAGRPREDRSGHAFVLGPGWVTPSAATARLRCDDMLVVRAALRNGAGLGVLPDFLARRDVVDGRLVRIAPASEAPSFAIYAVYPPVRPMPRRLRAFVDFLVDWFRTHPLPVFEG